MAPATDVEALPGPVLPSATRTTVELGVLGARVRVVLGAAAGATLDERWARCRPETGAVHVDEVTLPQTDLPLSPEMEQRLTERVNLAGIAHAATDHVLLHAAGLAAADGSVLGLVAPSGTGKTTAAIHLSTNGFGYVTDETLAIGADLRVRPWPKPLALVDPWGGPKRLRGPDDLGLGRFAGQLRLTRLVALERDPSCSRSELLPMSTAEAITLLVGQSSSLWRLPTPLRRLESTLFAVGGLRRLRYAEIEEAAPVLEGLLAHDFAPAPCLAPSSLRVFASPVRDALAVDGGLADFSEHGQVHLAGVGAEVWRAALGGVAFDDLVAAVAGRVGHHPDARKLVSAALDDLASCGLIKVE
ncbi:PqqD family protein [Nocardioides bigeumensis]|uniref:PqqD family peptide modification chaperone n=1 Tax=Nocardioides bigeumensis TaxID=433657 RepID=A0ABN2YHA4_9ACTN